MLRPLSDTSTVESVRSKMNSTEQRSDRLIQKSEKLVECRQWMLGESRGRMIQAAGLIANHRASQRMCRERSLATKHQPSSRRIQTLSMDREKGCCDSLPARAGG